MPRPFALPLILLALVFVLPVAAADPTPIEKQLAVQKAMATARQFLDLNMPTDAIQALEAEVANADGSKAFLTLLREAYLAELYRLEKSETPDAAKAEQVRRKLALLGGAVPVSKPAAAKTDELPPPELDPPGAIPTPAPAGDAAAEAASAFKKADYAGAARLFAAAQRLSGEQKAAWAYCRIKLGAETVKAAACDAATAAATIRDVTDALKLAPSTRSCRRSGRPSSPRRPRKPRGGRPVGLRRGRGRDRELPRAALGNRELADAVAKAAEESRKAIFQPLERPALRAVGREVRDRHPPDGRGLREGHRSPRAGSTGTAAVKLTNGRATERRIDPAADDAAIESNSLRARLTTSCSRTCSRTSRAEVGGRGNGDPRGFAGGGRAVHANAAALLARRRLGWRATHGDEGFPAEKITGFYCESVSLAEYLIRAGGSERNFTIFLRDCQRYGTAAAAAPTASMVRRLWSKPERGARRAAVIAVREAEIRGQRTEARSQKSTGTGTHARGHEKTIPASVLSNWSVLRAVPLPDSWLSPARARAHARAPARFLPLPVFPLLISVPCPLSSELLPPSPPRSTVCASPGGDGSAPIDRPARGGRG